jgi:hypothetical protein
LQIRMFAHAENFTCLLSISLHTLQLRTFN